LVNAERAPRQQLLDDQKTALDNKISSIGRIYASASDMKSTLAGFGSDPRMAAYVPQSSDSNKASFVFTSNPTNFGLSFEVKRLATENSVTLEGLTSTVTWPLSGKLVITQGSRAAPTTNVQTYDYSQYKSLDELKDAINAAGPYRAQILTSVSPTGTLRYLQITRGTGSERNFFVSTTDSSGVSPTDSSGNIIAPKDADGVDMPTVLRVGTPYTDTSVPPKNIDPGQANGVDAWISSGGHDYYNFKNTFTDLMPGVYITAKAVTEPGKPVTLSTSVDTSKFTDLVRQMVASYNEVQSTITNEIKYDPDVKKRGGLANDYVARSFLQQMRQMTTAPITQLGNNDVSLSSLGVRTNLDGSLEIDESKLAIAAQNPDLMEAVLASSTSANGTVKGAFQKLNDFADTIMGRDSALVKLFNQTDKTDRQKYQDRLDKLNSDMDALKQRYLTQFIAMQDYLNTTKSAQTSLTQSMAAWTASMKG